MIDALTAKQAVIKWRYVIGCRCMRMGESCFCCQSAAGSCPLRPHVMGNPLVLQVGRRLPAEDAGV